MLNARTLWKMRPERHRSRRNKNGSFVVQNGRTSRRFPPHCTFQKSSVWTRSVPKVYKLLSCWEIEKTKQFGKYCANSWMSGMGYRSEIVWALGCLQGRYLPMNLGTRRSRNDQLQLEDLHIPFLINSLNTFCAKQQDSGVVEDVPWGRLGNQ